jgi:hypothetical protein
VSDSLRNSRAGSRTIYQHGADVVAQASKEKEQEQGHQAKGHQAKVGLAPQAKR